MALLADAREGAGQREEDDLPPREELVEGRAGEACARRVWCSRRPPARGRPAGLRRKWAKKAAKEATTHRRTPRPRRPPRPRPTCAPAADHSSTAAAN